MRNQLANKSPYKVSNGGMRLWLAELQESDKEAQKIRAEGLNRYKKLDGVLYYYGLLFVLEVIWTEIIRQ